MMDEKWADKWSGLANGAILEEAMGVGPARQADPTQVLLTGGEVYAQTDVSANFSTAFTQPSGF
jgi:hypothetical protein